MDTEYQSFQFIEGYGPFYGFDSQSATEYVKENKCTTREQLQKIMDSQLLSYQQLAKTSQGEMKKTNSILAENFAKFKKKVESYNLFDELPQNMFYAIEIIEERIVLYIVAVEAQKLGENQEYISFDFNQPTTINDEYTSIVETNKMICCSYNLPVLDAIEYAKHIGANPNTVRQWIKRNKIRSAYKIGNQWQIPLLAKVRNLKDFISVRYSWDPDLIAPPLKYSYIKDYKGIRIESAFFHDDSTFDLSSDQVFSPEEIFSDGRFVITLLKSGDEHLGVQYLPLEQKKELELEDVINLEHYLIAERNITFEKSAIAFLDYNPDNASSIKVDEM